MNVLIVYAHPEPRSFNGALKDGAVAALSQAGHQVQVSDLYAMNFNPVVHPSEFPERANPDHFHLQREQRNAVLTGTVAPDVAAEHAKLIWADLLIFQFPLWWGSMPAIMKGWIDRVFSVGTIYGRETYAIEGKKALLSVTLSGYPTYEEGAAHATMELHHVFNNMFALSKLEAVEPFYVLGIGQKEEAERAAVLQAFRERVLSLCQ
ncbi:MAG TPA: NAD(P)H-dependent oxidoreductase [Symbiobacteriaceae bacterium]|nr:NAD(P)H-dependent oxidoreductase [Symbiobacteriaceae bacterium]